MRRQQMEKIREKKKLYFGDLNPVLERSTKHSFPGFKFSFDEHLLTQWDLQNFRVKLEKSNLTLYFFPLPALHPSNHD